MIEEEISQEEQRMVSLMEKVFKKLFEKHEEKQLEMFKAHEACITQIISANIKIINQRITAIANDIDDVKRSLEFTESELQDKIKIQENEMKKFKNYCDEKINNYSATEDSETKKLKDKIVDLENRSRRNNLRIDGISESAEETPEECELKALELFASKLNVNNVTIERAHRTGNINNERRKNKSRTIILKLLNYQDKIKILRNANKLKDTGIFINEDFAKETVEKRKQLWDEVKRLRLEGKYATLRFDRIVVRDRK